MRLPRWHPYFRLAVRFAVEPEQEAAPQLRALGIGAADVKRVVLTHMHIDHDGGLAGFPTSEILVSPGELAIASGLAGRLRGYLPAALAEEFRSAAARPRRRRLRALRPLAPADRRRGGRSRSRRPGHTRDHLSVVVEDGDAAVFIAGDASYTEEAMLAGRIDGVGADEGAERATLAAIRAFAASRPTIYLPAHDPDAARRLAGRCTTQAPPVMRPDGIAESGRAASGDVGAAAPRGRGRRPDQAWRRSGRCARSGSKPISFRRPRRCSPSPSRWARGASGPSSSLCRSAALFFRPRWLTRSSAAQSGSEQSGPLSACGVRKGSGAEPPCRGGPERSKGGRARSRRLVEALPSWRDGSALRAAAFAGEFLSGRYFGLLGPIVAVGKRNRRSQTFREPA